MQKVKARQCPDLLASLDIFQAYRARLGMVATGKANARAAQSDRHCFQAARFLPAVQAVAVPRGSSHSTALGLHRHFWQCLICVSIWLVNFGWSPPRRTALPPGTPDDFPIQPNNTCAILKSQRIAIWDMHYKRSIHQHIAIHHGSKNALISCLLIV
jgi:hypothetical protein